MVKKYGALRGADIEPVSVAMTRFADAFARPIPIVYRSLVNELVGSSHLSRVCAMWRYCALFAFGIDEIFAEFLRFYPDADERVHLYECVALALKFEKDDLVSDARAVREWCVGKTEDDVFAAAEGDGEGPVGQALAQARKGIPEDEWFYSRAFGFGVIRLMSAVDTPLTVENAERWAEKLKLPQNKIGTEMGSYLSISERLKQSEQMFAEIAAREARKTAERLAEKAEAAKKAAELLDEDGPKASDGDKTETTSEKPSTPVSARVEDA